ncbi:YdeI/OmpD-associated family protein [Polaribacter sp. P097]|uniref:YdeI/OmpD-associated family protein n=1 Tax=Polaribacter sp. P097 TaxID=3117398 RepID=UPI002FE0AD2E
MNNEITEYINEQDFWKEELVLLRSILNELPLVEDIKWGIPAYIFNDKNILGMSAFKNYVGLWFHQGVFLKDKANLLINAQENKTKALRQMRFSSIDEIDKELVKNYVLEAIENCKAGKEIKPTRNTKPVILPSELKLVLNSNKTLNDAFYKLTLSKQREYAEYISTAKKENTKNSRIEKIIPLIKAGKGLNDKYK